MDAVLHIKDIHYGSLPAQFLDIHIPVNIESGAPRPLLVFVHGGAWRSEDKSQHEQLAARLVLRTGCAVAVPNYRLTSREPRPPSDGGSSSPEYIHHPAHAHDILQALIFLISAHDTPARGMYDPARLFLVGHSCGAHILACLFLDSTPTPELTPPNELMTATRGIAVSEGIFDLDLLLTRFPEYRMWFIANAFGDAPSYPQYDVARYPLRADGEHIHWLVIHSRGDSLVDVGQAEKFYQHLCELGLESHNVAQKDWTSIEMEHNEMLKTKQYTDLVGDYFSNLTSEPSISQN
ncbi:hypothetical protein EW145_g6789 [Phellinidium pouzarii]|uniref:BD-FAE-like domain-containing protein n=1 Tax=Phellinidium pouzarii TaxID=167371 RepID=A0A4S4KTV1_9AGAM|nr:hypothetical protein EW145_g6789 [Phellinidium pouzarii]